MFDRVSWEYMITWHNQINIEQEKPSCAQYSYLLPMSYNHIYVLCIYLYTRATWSQLCQLRQVKMKTIYCIKINFRTAVKCKKYNLAIFSYIEYLKQKRFYSIITSLFLTFYSMHKYFQEIYGIKNLNGMTSHEYKNKLAKIIRAASLANKPCHNKRHS